MRVILCPSFTSGENTKKRATATQSVTCFVKRVKSSNSIFHDTLKCHYHDTFTYCFFPSVRVSQRLFLHCSLRCICVCEPSISIRFSPSFYQLKQCNIDKKVSISALSLVSLKSVRTSRKLMDAITGPNAIKTFAHQIIIKHYKKGRFCNDYKRMKIETTALGDAKAREYRSGQ